jgi:hypothetical protein
MWHKVKERSTGSFFQSRNSEAAAKGTHDKGSCGTPCSGTRGHARRMSPFGTAEVPHRNFWSGMLSFLPSAVVKEAMMGQSGLLRPSNTFAVEALTHVLEHLRLRIK